ncbi:MAG TPA: hypothetical protein VGN18_16865 [Jatrophihabitans sp.]|uniref:hypothetical protein n=1 Tax=Jatrophihabitans sp. TaxID=1932789 RepID=UPI002DFD17AF|nr:hypothetical protein [Jatrophihabitans sp.]
MTDYSGWPPPPPNQPGYPQPYPQQPNAPGYQQPYPQQYPPHGAPQPPVFPAPYPQQPHGPQQGSPGYPPYGAPPAPAPKRKRTRLVASTAVVVVAAGGIATYAAMQLTSGSAGASSPRAAVQGLADDLGRGDLVGVLDDLPPGERAAYVTPVLDTVRELQRNDVVRPDANLKKVSGVQIATSGLTFGSTTTINDHVRVVEITGGTLHVSADAAKLPLTQRFLSATHMPTSGSSTEQTVDLAREAAKAGRPLRIAVQLSGGSWYPSLFYSVADNAATDARLAAPTGAERIPDSGASSPDDAVRGVITSLLTGKVAQAIALTAPDELSVLHDYGKLIVDRATYSAAPVTLRSIAFKDTPVAGGTRVSLTKVDIIDHSGGSDQEVSISVDGSCIDMTMAGRSQHLCLDRLIQELTGLAAPANGGGSTPPGGFVMTPAQATAFKHLFSGLTDIGIVTTQHGGSWYVNPVRSYIAEVPNLLAHLQGNDLYALIDLGNR